MCWVPGLEFTGLEVLCLRYRPSGFKIIFTIQSNAAWLRALNRLYEAVERGLAFRRALVDAGVLEHLHKDDTDLIA